MAQVITVPSPATISGTAVAPTVGVSATHITVPAAAAIAGAAYTPAVGALDITITVPTTPVISGAAYTPSITVIDRVFKLLDEYARPVCLPSPTDDHGCGLYSFYFEDEVTLSMASTSNLFGTSFPPSFLVTQVSARITEAITGASTWEVGSSLNTARWLATNANVALNYTITGCAAYFGQVSTLEEGPIMGGQNEIYITTDAPAITGKIRLGVTGFFLKPFTS